MGRITAANAQATSPGSRTVETISPGDAQRVFGESFRAPGHVPICIASPGLLRERWGHTELGVALAMMTGITPVVTACEMIGDNGSLPKDKAVTYAETHGVTFIEGHEILEAWEAWSK